MPDLTDLPDDPSTGDGGEVVSVELPAEETPPLLDQADLPTPELLEAVEVVAPAVSSRWFPETVGGALYLGVLAVATVAVGVVVLGEWRIGVRIFAGALFAAALFRLALPTSKVGMLAVRSRAVDVLMHGSVAGLLLFLAGSIPDQPL